MFTKLGPDRLEFTGVIPERLIFWTPNSLQYRPKACVAFSVQKGLIFRSNGIVSFVFCDMCCWYLSVSIVQRCLTLSNYVPWQNWMVAYLGYTLRMETLFRGWPVMVHDTHMRRRRRKRSINCILRQPFVARFLASQTLCHLYVVAGCFCKVLASMYFVPPCACMCCLFSASSCTCIYL